MSLHWFSYLIFNQLDYEVREGPFMKSLELLNMFDFLIVVEL